MTHRLNVVGRAGPPEYKNNNYKNANTPKSVFLTVINCRIFEKFLHNLQPQNDTVELASKKRDPPSSAGEAAGV